MKAITVKYVGPSNTKGSRWIASCEGRHKITLSYDHALVAEQNAIEAAKALIKKLGWVKDDESMQLAIGQDAKGQYQVVIVEDWTTFYV